MMPRNLACRLRGQREQGEDYLGYDMVASKGAGRDVRGNAGGSAINRERC